MKDDTDSEDCNSSNDEHNPVKTLMKEKIVGASKAVADRRISAVYAQPQSS